MIRGIVYRNPQGMEYHFCPPMAYPGVPFGVCWLREIWDIEGNRIVFKRNAFGEVTEVVDSVGRHTYLTYDGVRHLLTRIVDPTGREINPQVALCVRVRPAAARPCCANHRLEQHRVLTPEPTFRETRWRAGRTRR
ncbi:MAG: hypothetical protein AB1486_33680 [Planctomycetota bacterium]